MVGILLTLVLSSFSALALGEPLRVVPEGPVRLIGKHFQLCQCPDNLQFQDFINRESTYEFESIKTDRVEIKRRGGTYWLRLQIFNPKQVQVPRTLLIAHNSANWWKFYNRADGSWVERTSGVQYQSAGFYPVFPLQLAPGMNTFYLNFDNDRFDVWFGSAENVSTVPQQQLHYAASNMTLSGLITLVSLAIAILLKDSLFYYYAFFTFSAFTFMFFSSNILIIYGINFFSWAEISIVQVMGFCMAYELISTLLFISQFLRLKENAPEIFKVILPFGFIAFASLLIQMITGIYNEVFQTAVIILHCFLITGVFIYGIRKGIHNAKKAMYSWGVYVAGITVTSVLMLGRYRLAGLNISWAAMNFEMLLFGVMGLRDLYNRQLKMSQDINHSYQQLQKLVYPKQVEAMKRGQLLEETMPIEKADAVIISFDIINSTRIKSDLQHQFFEDFFVQCQLLMSEGVSVNGDLVKVFKVKEMGDGFIASVGFPFSCQTSEGLAALAFIDRVKEIFYENVDKHLQGHECGFGVGITGGQVGGYFPRSGIVQYDLYGMPVVLATRYEAMRKYFQDTLNQDESILIVQDQVFDQLPHEIQKNFTCHNLEDSSFKVRDDPEAKRLWYRILRKEESVSVQFCA